MRVIYTSLGNRGPNTNQSPSHAYISMNFQQNIWNVHAPYSNQSLSLDRDLGATRMVFQQMSLSWVFVFGHLMQTAPVFKPLTSAGWSSPGNSYLYSRASHFLSVCLVPTFQVISFAGCSSRKIKPHGEGYPSTNIYWNSGPSQVPVICYSYFRDVKNLLKCPAVSLQSGATELPFP